MSTPSRSPRLSLLLLAYLAFVSLGLPDGLLGVGWPSIRDDFVVPTESVGLLLALGTAGYLSASVLAGFGLERLGVGLLLAGSTALTALALAGYALAPSLVPMAAFALVLGLGGGAIDAGLNAYAASTLGPRHMNWMHAFFGLGVALGPLIMTAVLGTGAAWRWGYGLVCAAQLVLASAFLLTARSWDRGRPAPDGGPTPSPTGGHPADGHPVAGHPAGGHETPGHPVGGADAAAAGADQPRSRPRLLDTLRLPAMWLSSAGFAVYVGVEVGVGLWAFLLLTEARGLSAPVAGLCVSGYWGALFVGRVVLGIVAERLGSRPVLRGGVLGMALGCVLIALPAPAPVTVVGMVVVGFAAAPVFPLLTLATADRVGARHANRVIGLQIAAAGAGGAAIPAGIGVLIGNIDVRTLGPALVVLSIALIALVAAAERSRPRQDQDIAVRA